MKRLKKTGRPLVLTVRGKPEAVLLNTAACQEIAEHLDAMASIRNGLSQVNKKWGHSVDVVFDDLERAAASSE